MWSVGWAMWHDNISPTDKHRNHAGCLGQKES